ncbi:hypothetical protein BN13_1090030 [Nostocoides jenkinsii Ben 74]|uniref:Uncharacterized protein n=1 Tax=Nostocoides jenkinsii Ben 74 TaxID=1193518 RepID=A0A077M723_9MICO|nr:hypothetical protein BN13_1090030 [Tetrasphaera jenkinsii Ben 74]
MAVVGIVVHSFKRREGGLSGMV